MDALDVYTKRNIYDYLAKPEEKYDKDYSEERQKIRNKAIDNAEFNLIRIGKKSSEISSERYREMIKAEEELIYKNIKKLGLTGGLFMFGITNIWG